MVLPWVARGAVTLDNAQARIAGATAAYLAASAPAGERTPVPIAASQVTSEALRGVPADELLHRAPEQAWWALSEGETPEQATDRGALRVVALVAVGLQLAHTHTARHVMTRQNVARYRRAARANSCDLCILAASQTYATSNLMPIHDGCACVVVPAWGGSYERLGGESLADEAYQDEVAVHEHGELGPVLTDASHAFHGPH